MSIKSEEERKCQESIQLVSHLTQNTWESDKRRKRHIQKRLEGQLRRRAVAVYSKVVRRRKPSSAEGTKGWRALEGYMYHSTLSFPPPPPPEILFYFSALLCSFLMGFNLQLLWIMLFLLECSEKPNAGHNPSS